MNKIVYNPQFHTPINISIKEDIEEDNNFIGMLYRNNKKNRDTFDFDILKRKIADPNCEEFYKLYYKDLYKIYKLNCRYIERYYPEYTI